VALHPESEERFCAQEKRFSQNVWAGVSEVAGSTLIESTIGRPIAGHLARVRGATAARGMVRGQSVPPEVARSISAMSPSAGAGGAQKERERLRDATRAVRLDVISIVEDDGTVRYESPAIEGVGYRPEERVGKHIFTHPDD